MCCIVLAVGVSTRSQFFMLHCDNCGSEFFGKFVVYLLHFLIAPLGIFSSVTKRGHVSKRKPGISRSLAFPLIY